MPTTPLAKPKMTKRFILWAGLNLFALVLLIAGIWNLVSEIQRGNHQPIETGKRIVVDINTGTVQSSEPVVYTAQDIDLPNAPKNSGVEGEEKVPPAQYLDDEVSGPPLPPKERELTAAELDARPKVAVVITNVGLDKAMTDILFALPPKITFSFSPYVDNAQSMVDRANKAGFESFLDIPMEDTNYPFSDPGIFGLLTASENEDNRQRLASILNSAEGYKGILAPSNEQFTSMLSKMIPLLDLLKGNSTVFVYQERSGNRFVFDELRSVGITAARDYILLDEVPSQTYIDTKLREIEKLAAERGGVIVVARPYPLSIKLLESWMTQPENKQKVAFMHVSEMIRHFTEKNPEPTTPPAPETPGEKAANAPAPEAPVKAPAEKAPAPEETPAEVAH